jgi:hypothetical protein
MKANIELTASRNAAKRISTGLGFAFPLALAFIQLQAIAQEVNLGAANNFEVLSAAGITSTGSTVINGNIGASPITGAAITGLTAAQVNGTIYTTDGTGPTGNVQDAGLLTTATSALTTAYNQAAGLSPTANLTGLTLGSGGTVGTATAPLTPGVYHFQNSAQITGTLYLNDEGLSDPVFVFQIGSTLTTASASSVVEENAAAGSIPGTSVFWQVGSSATLGTTTAFDGNILAYTSISLDNGATDLDGRLLAMGGGGVGGAVTLIDNGLTAPPAEVIGGGSSIPDTGSTLPLLGSALAALFAFGRRFSSLPAKFRCGNGSRPEYH